MEEPKYINMSARSTVDAKALFGQAVNAKSAAASSPACKKTAAATAEPNEFHLNFLERRNQYEQ